MSLHEMYVIKSSETGAEEWNCPSCGRRLLLRWPPHHERTVLRAGDERVVHVGGRGAAPTADTPITGAERLWLSDHGIIWD